MTQVLSLIFQTDLRKSIERVSENANLRDKWIHIPPTYNDMHKYLKHEQEFVLTMHTSNIYKNNKIAFLFFHSGSYMRLDTSINVLKHASVCLKKKEMYSQVSKNLLLPSIYGTNMCTCLAFHLNSKTDEDSMGRLPEAACTGCPCYMCCG